jgi:hypothetical protein
MQEEHLTRKRKTSKTVMKTRNMIAIISNHLKEKGIIENSLQLHHRPLAIFEALIIYFSQNTLHQAKQNHPPNILGLKTTNITHHSKN